MHINLEYRNGTSGKFWQLKVSGATQEIRFGKIGTMGQRRTRTFASAREAREAAEQLQQGKIRALGPVKDVLAVRAAFLAARKPGASKPRKLSRRG